MRRHFTLSAKSPELAAWISPKPMQSILDKRPGRKHGSPLAGPPFRFVYDSTR